MGVRKRQSAEVMKEARKSQAFAKLINVPSSPRKMRLVADMVRGKEVFRALGILKFSNKEASAKVEKLLRSAIANWEYLRLKGSGCPISARTLPHFVFTSPLANSMRSTAS